MIFKEKLVKHAKSRAMLIFLGSTFFAFCLLVLIHETGHALALLILGFPDISLVITPFYGITRSSGTITMDVAPFISVAGPVFDLIIASTILIIFWRKRSTNLLPLLIYGGTAFLTEGIVMLNTFFTSTILTDWDVILFVGFSPYLFTFLTVLVLLIGSFMIYLIWPLVGISNKDSFSKKFYINLGYFIFLLLSFFFLIVANLTFNPDIMLLGVLNLIISISFLALRVLGYKPFFPLIDRFLHTDVNYEINNSVWIPLAIGGFTFFFFIFFIN
jgi:hypothetical protein